MQPFFVEYPPSNAGDSFLFGTTLVGHWYFLNYKFSEKVVHFSVVSFFFRDSWDPQNQLELPQRCPSHHVGKIWKNIFQINIG